jgi:DNA invertase Pin-like site-specific DNA recombinase
MADAHKRRFDVVCVWRFDRFARSVSHLLRALETFKALGVDFVSYSEQMDTSTPAGKMVFTVLGAVAELERSLIVERVRAGLRNARAKGKKLGRPRRVLDTKRIAALRAKGIGWKQIAADIGVGVGTIYRAALEGAKVQENAWKSRLRQSGGLHILSEHHPELSPSRLELKCAFCNIFPHAKSCQNPCISRPVLSCSL